MHPGHESDAHAAGQEGIFAIGLLAAAPAGIAKDVDVWRPEGEAIEDAVIAFALRLIVFGAGFVGDDVTHRVHHRGIPGGRHADGLREDGRIAGAGDPVKSFAPSLIIGHTEARHGGRPVLKLVGLFLQRHAADKIACALLRRQLGVEVIGWRRGGDQTQYCGR